MPSPLADTSVWIDALRSGRTVLPEMTARDEPIGYTEPVLMELTSNCRTPADARAVRRLLVRGQLLSFDAAADFEGAAIVFAAAQRRGITLGSLVRCMVVAVAARHDAPLITLDARQGQVAELFGVTVLPA